MKEKVVFKEKKKPLSASDKVFNVFNYLLFGLLTLICLYPFYYLIINTISANDLSANGLITLIPKGIHFENYKQVLQLSGLSTAALISVARTVLGTGLTVLASAFLGFMFTQEKMWGRSFWYRVIVITMYFNAGLIPMFITMKTLHLNNTFWVYILPACTPILATVAIFAAVAQWNSFQDTLIYITDQKLYSLQYLLYTYINQASSLATMVKNSTGGALNMAAIATQQTPTSIRMTVSVIVVLPILFIYPLFQRFFVKGIMIGSVKG